MYLGNSSICWHLNKIFFYFRFSSWPVCVWKCSSGRSRAGWRSSLRAGLIDLYVIWMYCFVLCGRLRVSVSCPSLLVVLFVRSFSFVFCAQLVVVNVKCLLNFQVDQLNSPLQPRGNASAGGDNPILNSWCIILMIKHSPSDNNSTYSTYT
jgi:hypothetical protein